MWEMTSNRWIRYAALTFMVGAAVGAVVTFLIFSRGPSATVLGDRVVFTSGGSIPTGAVVLETDIENFSHYLPLTTAEAVAAGWEDPILCSPGRGRYFWKGTPDEGEPYFLLYTDQDELIGIYQFIQTEMPAPWRMVDELIGGGGLRLLEEHWSLLIFFRDSTRACTSEAQREDAGRSGDWIVTAARSTPTPYIAPTPTPVPAVALEAAASRMSLLSSLSFTLVAEPEGALLMPDIQARSIQGSVELPGDVTLQATDAAGVTSEVSVESLPFDFTDLGVKIAAIARAMQGLGDAPRQWIDNVPSRGATGTILGEHLGGLVPSVPPEAQLTVQMWFSDDGLVHRIRVEGPMAPDDPPGVVRVLDLRDFN